MILLTVTFVFCLIGYVSGLGAEIDPRITAVLIVFGAVLAAFWIYYVKKRRKSEENVSAGPALREPRKEPVRAAEYTCVKCGKTVPEAESVLLEGKRFCRGCSYSYLYRSGDKRIQSVNTAYSDYGNSGSHDIVALKCKVCGRELFYIRGRSTRQGMIRLQSGTYCADCLHKLLDDDAAEILFLIDAVWGQYSKRVEFRGGKYYYVESRVRTVVHPMGVWEEDEFDNEITYEQALSYAVSEGDKENLKAIESIRKTKKRLAALNIDKEVLAHIRVGVGRLDSDVGYQGVPYMRHVGDDLWSGATDYDDMRGPQDRFDRLPFDEAIKKFVSAVIYFAKHPERYYTAPARPAAEKIDPRYITDHSKEAWRVRISHSEYDEKANIYREVKFYDVVLNDEQSLSEDEYSRIWESKLETLFVLASGRPSLDSVYTVARHKKTKQAYIVKEAFLIQDCVRFKWRYISKITEYQLKILSEQRQSGQ